MNLLKPTKKMLVAGLAVLALNPIQGVLAQESATNGTNVVINNNIIAQFENSINMDTLIPGFPTNPYGERREYEDFLSSCRSYVEQLGLAFQVAMGEWFAGNHAGAITILETELANQALQVSGRRSWDLPPNTAVAITSAWDIVKTVNPIISQRLPQNPNQILSVSNGVKMNLLYRLYKFIDWTYSHLDNQYYSPVIDNYFDFYNSAPGRSFIAGPTLPGDLFGSVLELGQELLKIQSEVQRYLADDYVELKTTQVFARASRNLLTNSVLRREMCGPIRGLKVLEDVVSYYTSGTTRLRSQDQVRAVRGMLKKVSDDLMRTNRHGYGYGCRY